MKWFKFYGQDWLTDAKVVRMIPEDRLCFITLLCLASASDDGIIRGYDEKAIILLTHLWDDQTLDHTPANEAVGCLGRFNDNAMITLENENDANNCIIIIKNFAKRQESNLTPYERVKKYRDKQKLLPDKINKKNVINDNAVIRNDNQRTEQNRLDKNRITNKLVDKISMWITSQPTTIDNPEAWVLSLISKYGDSSVSSAFDKMNNTVNPSPAKMARMLKENSGR